MLHAFPPLEIIRFRNINAKIRCLRMQFLANQPHARLIVKRTGKTRQTENDHNHLAALCNQGHLREALGALDYLDGDADRATYACLVRGCGNLETLKRVHAHISKSGLAEDLFLKNHLVREYDRCCSLEDARRIFDKMVQRNAVSWNVMIAACSQHGQCKEALNLFERMQKEGVGPSKVTFINTLKACTSMVQGYLVHACITNNGFESDIVVGNALISMYGKCGNLEDALEMAFKMSKRDVISWTSVIAAHVQEGYSKEALKFYQQMLSEGVMPNNKTFVTILNACVTPADLFEGKMIHVHVIEGGYDSHDIVTSALLSFYGKNGKVEDAQAILNNFTTQDIVTWNSMIAVYVNHGLNKDALQVFQQMLCQGVRPNNFTFVNTLDACASLSDLQEGKVVHNCMLDSGVESDILRNALVSMYGNCGSLLDAITVFNKLRKKDVVSWTSMIQAYTQNGQENKALQAFQHMRQEGVRPNKVTFITILKACSSPNELEDGKLVHTLILGMGLDMNIVVGNSLVTMYGRCGSLIDMTRVFTSMPEHDVISWTAMMSAHGQHGYGKETFEFFQQMQQDNVKPNKVTYVSMLDACATSAALAEGKLIHCLMVESGMESDVVSGNSLINMYAKCGKVDEALLVFYEAPERDIVSWTAVIAAYAYRGEGKEALRLLRKMNGTGINPDDITFVNVLSACSHAGLVDEGFQFLYSMSEDYKISPTVEHYRIMIDMLGRAGRLEEAEVFVNKLPRDATVIAWITLLGACRVHGNVEKGQCAAERILELDPQRIAGYVVLSNIYATAGKFGEADKIRRTMLEKGVKNVKGQSSTEFDHMVTVLDNDRETPNQTACML